MNVNNALNGLTPESIALAIESGVCRAFREALSQGAPLGVVGNLKAVDQAALARQEARLRRADTL